jgi:hypothetical protein
LIRHSEGPGLRRFVRPFSSGQTIWTVFQFWTGKAICPIFQNLFRVVISRVGFLQFTIYKLPSLINSMLTNYKRGIYKLQSALKNVSFTGFTNMNHSTSFDLIRLLIFRNSNSGNGDACSLVLPLSTNEFSWYSKGWSVYPLLIFLLAFKWILFIFLSLLVSFFSKFSLLKYCLSPS